MRGLLLLLTLLCGTALAAAPPGDFGNGECIACHGEHSPEVHSYATSKHGVLLRIGRPGRVPDCVDCHTARAHETVDAEQMQSGCNHCHSPRYVQTLQANGARMFELGELKQQEALQLLTHAREAFPAAAVQDMEVQYLRLQKHLRNLRLGIAHQSPDYQWWHGHPALDGDLLRIKGAYDRMLRQHALERQR